jgi:hypothetical protein
MYKPFYEYRKEGTLLGRWVYKYGTTTNIGKIIKVFPPTGNFVLDTVEVAWVKGTVVQKEVLLETELLDFQTVIDDHRRKLVSHDEKLKRGENILAKIVP